MVEVYHSQIPEWKQQEIASNLLDISGHVKIVIATSALSMGFDAVGENFEILIIAHYL
jgi:superfamily II DNA helicase RecQ